MCTRCRALHSGIETQRENGESLVSETRLMRTFSKGIPLFIHTDTTLMLFLSSSMMCFYPHTHAQTLPHFNPQLLYVSALKNLALSPLLLLPYFHVNRQENQSPDDILHAQLLGELVLHSPVDLARSPSLLLPLCL